MVRIYILLLCVGSCGLFAQTAEDSDYITYYTYCNEALYRIHLEEYTQAEQLYEAAFSIASPKAKDAYHRAYALAHLGERRNCAHYLEQAASHPYLDIVGQVRADKASFLKVFSEESFESLCKELSLAKLVAEQVVASDFVHQSIQDSVQRLFQDFSEVWERADITATPKNESGAYERLRQFVTKYGCPNLPTTHAEQFLKMLTYNGWTEAQEKALRDLLWQEVQTGHFAPYHFAQVLLVHKDQTACLGLQAEAAACTHADILKNRQLIGLSPYFKNPTSSLDYFKTAWSLVSPEEAQQLSVLKP